MPEDINFSVKPIGFVRTPFTSIKDMPIQPKSASNVRGSVIVDPIYAEGLADLGGFSHIYLIYHFHKVTYYKLTVTPFLDDKPRGLFATRAPTRPNPIGISIVRLLSIEENILMISDVDMLDATPILDIKPYVPAFDHREVKQVGWLTGRDDEIKTKRSDERFES